MLRTDEVVPILAANAAQGTKPFETAHNSRAGIGGRTKKHDSEKLLIEAAKLLYDGLAPKSQSELRCCALEEYSAHLSEDQDQPSDEWAKPIIRRLWNRLELGEP
jgi:hypothetical protein